MSEELNSISHHNNRLVSEVRELRARILRRNSTINELNQRIIDLTVANCHLSADVLELREENQKLLK